ncbi:MAG: nitroreductase family protein [Culicoidibacterales bacterium]
MSNQTIEIMKNRKSVRQFTGETVSEQIVNQIVEAAHCAPNSINAQQTSVIITRDKEKIAKIAEITGGQPQVAAADVFITVVVDFNKTNEALKLNGEVQTIQSTLEGILVGAVDAGIMVEALAVAAESFGIGNTVIGGIRNNPQAMIDLLELPEYTFPIVGITLGYMKENTAAVKPKMDLNSFAHVEKYDAENVVKGVKAYDAVLEGFFKKLGLDMPTNSQAISKFYSQPYYPEVKPTLKKQGFDTK